MTLAYHHYVVRKWSMDFFVKVRLTEVELRVAYESGACFLCSTRPFHCEVSKHSADGRPSISLTRLPHFRVIYTASARCRCWVRVGEDACRRE